MTTPKASFGERHSGVAYQKRHSAYAVVMSREDRIAVVCEAGRYYLPGGAVEPGETAIQAVVREAQEECGVELAVHSLLCSADQILTVPGEGHFLIEADIFLGALEHGEPANGALVWLQSDQARGLLSRQFEAWAVSIAMRNSAI